MSDMSASKTDPTTLQPTITIDFDFDSFDAADERAEDLETFIATIPGTIPARAVVEGMDDDVAIWLRARVTLDRYDAELAAQVADQINEWAAAHGRDWNITF